LERKNRDLTSFANIASHDLKEPLRKIEMFSGRLIQTNPGNLTDQSREFMDKIFYQTTRMRNLIDSILKYAQTDDETLGFQQTNLNETAGLAIESLSEIIKEKKATISVQQLPTLFCSPNQMTQVFINLLENGLKYTRPDSPPYLEIKARPLTAFNEPDSLIRSGWQIDFCDNGIGFDQTYATKIFEIFQRLHSADEYPGTGIGLAICKKIIENHRGKIFSKSVVGQGSIFSVILPTDITQTHNA
jgi:light-regulated signal transduction histidine kinase (bacteriophytochrome)